MSMSSAIALTLIKLSTARRNSFLYVPANKFAAVPPPLPMAAMLQQPVAQRMGPPPVPMAARVQRMGPPPVPMAAMLQRTGPPPVPMAARIQRTGPPPVPMSARVTTPMAAVPERPVAPRTGPPPVPEAARVARPSAAVPPPTPAAAQAAASGATSAASNVQAAARSARRFVNPSLARFGRLGLIGAGTLGALGTAVGTLAYLNPSGISGQSVKSGYEAAQTNLRSTGNLFGRKSDPNVPAIAVPSDANPQEGAGDPRPQQTRGKGTGITTPLDQGYNFSPDPNVNDPYVRIGRIAGYALPNVSHLPPMPTNYNELKNTVIHRLGVGALGEESARRNDLGAPSIAQEVTSRAIGGIREGMQNLGQQFGQYFNRP